MGVEAGCAIGSSMTIPNAMGVEAIWIGCNSRWGALPGWVATISSNHEGVGLKSSSKCLWKEEALSAISGARGWWTWTRSPGLAQSSVSLLLRLSEAKVSTWSSSQWRWTGRWKWTSEEVSVAKRKLGCGMTAKGC